MRVAAGGRVCVRITARRAQRGMTLVEIMVVLMIIGLVTALVGVAAYDAYENALQKDTRIQLQKLQEGLALYRLAHRRLPTSAEGLAALVTPAERRPPVMRKLPRDGWGRDYVYLCPGRHEGEEYDLYSLGKNGIEGDEDDINSWDDGAAAVETRTSDRPAKTAPPPAR